MMLPPPTELCSSSEPASSTTNSMLWSRTVRQAIARLDGERWLLDRIGEPH